MIRRLAVFGERCSGTNHARALLEENLPLVWRDCGWKHGFPEEELLQGMEDTLVLVVCRNVADWARSLFRTPHHVAPELRSIRFGEFIRHAFHCVYDHQSGHLPRHPDFGRPMLNELRADGTSFVNLARMRAAKHKAWLRLLTRVPSGFLLRHEDAVTDPLGTVQRIAAHCKLPPPERIAEVEDYKGKPSRGKYVARAYPPILPEDAEFLQSQLDAEVEAKLGYQITDGFEAASFQRYLDEQKAGDPLHQRIAAALRALNDGGALLAEYEAAYEKQQRQAVELAEMGVIKEDMRGYTLSLFSVLAERPMSGFKAWLLRREGLMEAR